MAFDWTDKKDYEDYIMAEDVNSLARGIRGEETARETADGVLRSAISDEAAARETADGALDARISANTANIADAAEMASANANQLRSGEFTKLTVTEGADANTGKEIVPLKARTDRIDMFKHISDNETYSEVVIKSDGTMQLRCHIDGRDNTYVENLKSLETATLLMKSGGFDIFKIIGTQMQIGSYVDGSGARKPIATLEWSENVGSGEAQDLALALNIGNGGERIAVDDTGTDIKFSFPYFRIWSGSNEVLYATDGFLKLRCGEANALGKHTSLQLLPTGVRLCGDIDIYEPDINSVWYPDDATDEETAFVSGSLVRTLINLKRKAEVITYPQTPARVGTWIDGTPVYRYAFKHALTEAEIAQGCYDIFSGLLKDTNKAYTIARQLNMGYCDADSVPCMVDENSGFITKYMGGCVYFASGSAFSTTDCIWGYIDFVTPESNLK